MITDHDTAPDPEPTDTAVAGEPPITPLRDLAVELDIEDPAPARGLDPIQLREAIAAGLQTTNAEVLEDAAGDFRGIYSDIMEYIRLQLLDLLQPWLAWVLECCEPDRLRGGYEAGKLLVWALPHPRDPCLLLVFESPRTKFRFRR